VTEAGYSGIIMVEKKQILKELMPLAVLKAMSSEAVSAVPQGMIVGDLICIRKFPFRIGRESRVRTVNGKIERIERPKIDNREPNNDLYLVDQGLLLNISREHLLIEKTEDTYLLIDRGSACGTKINGEPLGGDDSGGSRILCDDDIITIGTKESPYSYRFIDLNTFEIA